MARELFGPDLYKERVLELNASDERGINVVRTKVKAFASLSASAAGDAASKYPCPPYKIIILDEADSMTADAQTALRRLMEQHSKVTRFCLICNYVSRIIDPITSRCAKFRFKPLDSAILTTRLQAIADGEGVTIANSGALTQLVNCSGGDMRKAITYLQSASRLFGGTLTEEAVVEMAGLVPPERIEGLLKISGTNNWGALQAAVNDLAADGYSAVQTLTQLSPAVINYSGPELLDVHKAQIIMKLAEADKALADGSDESLQLLAVVGHMQKVFASASATAV